MYLRLQKAATCSSRLATFLQRKDGPASLNQSLIKVRITLDGTVGLLLEMDELVPN